MLTLSTAENKQNSFRSLVSQLGDKPEGWLKPTKTAQIFKSLSVKKEHEHD